MEHRKIYPLTFIENVIDERTGENLYIYLSQFNHVNVGYVANKEDARNLVPEILRKQGLFITYYLKDSAITEYFDGNKTLISQEGEWQKDVYWRQINNFVYSGTTELRPDNIPVGTSYFDTTLKKCFWWTGEEWVTYPDDVEPKIKIKRTDITSTHRRCVELIEPDSLPDEIIEDYPTFDKIVKIALYDGTFYLIDADNKYYSDGHNIETAHIFVKKGTEPDELYYYVEEDKSLTEITEKNIHKYILPLVGTSLPDFGSVNPYADGEYFILDTGYNKCGLVAYPTTFYGNVIEAPRDPALDVEELLKNLR